MGTTMAGDARDFIMDSMETITRKAILGMTSGTSLANLLPLLGGQGRLADVVTRGHDRSHHGNDHDASQYFQRRHITSACPR